MTIGDDDDDDDGWLVAGGGPFIETAIESVVIAARSLLRMGWGGVSFIVGAGVCELWRKTETWNWEPPHSNPIQYKAMYLLGQNWVNTPLKNFRL